MKGLLLALTIGARMRRFICRRAVKNKPASDKTAPADEFAEMGKDEGTHTGEHGSKPENDTKEN